MLIEIMLKDEVSTYKIGKELNRAINTIINEIKRGTTKQISNDKYIAMYLADASEANYKKNRIRSYCKFKGIICTKFIKYVIKKMRINYWSSDAYVGNTILKDEFKRSEIIYIKAYITILI